MSSNPAFGVRECHGHWHVTCCGEDLAYGDDPTGYSYYTTREAAATMAATLNSPHSAATPESPVVVAPPAGQESEP